MRKRFLKTVTCLALTASMIFGESSLLMAQNATVTPDETPDEVTVETEDLDAVGYNVISSSQGTLDSVTGIKCDTVNERIYWNAVSGADYYEITVKDTVNGATALQTYTQEGMNCLYYDYSDFYGYGYYDENGNWQYCYGFVAGRTYTISIVAKSSDDIYILKSGISEDEYDAFVEQTSDNDYEVYRTTNKGVPSYTIYKFAQSAAATANIMPNPSAATSNTRAVTAVSSIAKKALTDSTLELTVTTGTMTDSEYIRVEYSNNKEFKSNGNGSKFVREAFNVEGGGITDSEYASDGIEGNYYYQYEYDNTTYSVNLNYFLPGETVYVRARIYNYAFEINEAANETKANKFSAYKTFTYTVPTATMGTVSTTVTKNSVTLKPTVSSGNVTGYEYQKKINGSWVTIAKQSGSVYKDTGLKADQTYDYRVRGYSYSKITKKTKNTGWQKVSVYTWGSSLQLKAGAASSKSVKLSWKKVSKASGYEIYRSEYSVNYTKEKGISTDSFENSTLVKTIKKASTTSYTDKKLTAGKTYNYTVRAYRTINGKNYYISDFTSITLSGTAYMEDSAISYYTSSGKYTVQWAKMTGIKGYKVEKLDLSTNKYVAVKTLKASATSYTAPKTAVGKQAVTYRIYPYTKTKSLKGQAYYFNVSPKLAAVQGVKATKTTNGIKISWKAVSGADYYEVYRCTSDAVSYDKTTGTYNMTTGELVSSVSLDTSDVLSLTPYYMYQGTDYNNYNYDNTGHYVSMYNDDGDWAPALYNDTKTFITEQITGTSVVDKTVTVNALVKKTEAELANNKDIDSFSEYKKSSTGVLETTTATLYEGPEAGVTYYYVVMAYAKAKDGSITSSSYYNPTSSVGYSKPASAMYTANTVKKATKVQAKSKKTAQVTISFKKASKASGYLIYRSTKKSKGYTLVGSTTKKTFTDKSVTAGKTYYYKVKSYRLSEAKERVYSSLTAAKKVTVKK